MEKGKRQYLLLGTLILLVAVLVTVSTLLIAASADNSDYEAVLKVTVAGGESTEYGGTYQAMHEKLASLMKAQTDADVSYVLTLNKDAKYTTHKDLVMNTALAEGSYSRVTIDLNGHKLTASGMHNNLYTVKGTTTSTLVITVDGADKAGNRGQIYCPDKSGALFYTRANDDLNVNTIATAQNLELYYTNLSAGYSDNGSANQPMMHLPAGKEVYIKNVKMTYTGENATAQEGKSLTDMNTPFFTIGSVGKVVIEDCEFIDTNTKGIMTKGVHVSSALARVTVSNTKIKAYYGVHSTNASSTVEIKGCDIEGTKATYRGAGKMKVIDTVSRVGEGGAFTSSASNLYLIYGNGRNEIHSLSTIPESYIIQDGYTLENENGIYFMAEDTSVEATLCINPYGAAPTFTTGKYDTLHASIKSVKPTVPTTYTLVLNKDAKYTSSASLSLNSNVTITVDCNGHTLTATASSILYLFTGDATLNIDGDDRNGNRGKIISKTSSGTLIYPRTTTSAPNDGAKSNITNIELLYTNMAHGYDTVDNPDVTEYPNQPLLNVAAGTVVMDNVKITYTGEDAYAVVGSNGSPEGDISVMITPFVVVTGSASLTVNNCEFIDTNTKGIRTQGIRVQSSKPVTVTNTKIVARTGIQISGNRSAYIENSDIEGTNTTYNGTGYITVCDTISRAPVTLNSSAVQLHLLYGTGKTEIYTAGGSEVPGTYTVQDGYKLYAYEDGKFKVAAGGSEFTSVTMPPIFSDGMVFQRGKEINVYGYCDIDGSTIEVTLDGVLKIATVKDGKWSVSFDPLPAMKGLTLTVTETTVEYPETFTFENIDIGEVWLMGGQSNAQYEAYKLEDFEEYVLNADNYDNIRFYSAPMKTRPVEQPLGTGGGWYQVTSELLRNDGNTTDYDISAIAYITATRLAAELDDNVTVAMLDVNYNGSKIVTWLDEEIYKEHFPNNSDIALYERYKEFYLANGKMPASAEDVAGYQQKPYSWLPSGNYNAMMSSLEGFNIKGAIWMQGCSDTGNADYDKYYAALMETFRMTFNDETLPCFVIQIQPYGSGMSTALRALQYAMVDADPYSYLITTATDGTVLNKSDFANNSGDYTLVHTSRKSPIGQRLGQAILYHIYGYEEYASCISPKVIKVEADGNKLIVTFDTEIRTELGTSNVHGFEIAGANGSYVDAVGTISGNTVTLVADGVSAPTSVRYGYGKMVIELQDGTLLPYTKVEYTSTSVTVKNPNGGEDYVFERGTDLVIRSTINANVYTVDGQSIPIFLLEVGYERK